MSKSILDVYKEKHGQFIILISGLAMTGKKKLGHSLEHDLHLKYIDANKFTVDNRPTVQLPNGVSVVNGDTDDAINWEKLNNEVIANKEGVVVVGTAFPKDKITFKSDYHIHLKMPKQVLKTKREEYIKSHPDKKYNLETEMLRINILTYPYYVEVLPRMNVDKYINVAESTPDKIYDSVFDLIVKFIWDNIPPPSKKEETKVEKKSEDRLGDDDVDTSDIKLSSTEESLSLSDMEKNQQEFKEGNVVAGFF
jgi:hypothetical protein